MSSIFRTISSDSNEYKGFWALADSGWLLLECWVQVSLLTWYWNWHSCHTMESSVFAKIQLKKSFQTSRSWHDPGYLGIKVW